MTVSWRVNVDRKAQNTSLFSRKRMFLSDPFTIAAISWKIKSLPNHCYCTHKILPKFQTCSPLQKKYLSWWHVSSWITKRFRQKLKLCLGHPVVYRSNFCLLHKRVVTESSFPMLFPVNLKVCFRNFSSHLLKKNEDAQQTA